MLIPIIIFLVSLFLIVGFILFKLNKVRTGNMPSAAPFEPEEFVKEHVWENVKYARKQAAKYGKKYGHELVLQTLRGWIKLSFLVKRKKEWLKPRVHKLIEKIRGKKVKKSAAVSNFLKNISEYKQKLREMKAEMEEEEKKHQK